MTGTHDTQADRLAADFERHGRYVRRLAGALAASNADDVSQDVWTAWAAADRGRVKSPRTWLAAVARKVALRRQRDERHRRDREATVAALRQDGTGADGDASDIWVDVSDRLQDALKSLDMQLRDVIVLRYLEGLPPGDIALRLELPLTTVTSRLKRAMAAMRRRLDTGRPDWRAAIGLALPSGAQSVPPLSGRSGTMSEPTPRSPRTPGLRSMGQASLTALAVMKMKLAFSALAVAGLAALLWLRAYPSPEPLADLPAPADSSAAQEPRLAAPGTDGRRLSGGAPAAVQTPDRAPVAREAHFCLNVRVKNLHGGPLIGAKVWVAPVDGVPNLVGRTDRRGELQAQWHGRQPSMVVDVMIHGLGEEDSGVQRIRMRADRPFQVTAQLGRPVVPVERLAGELSRLQARLNGRIAGERLEPPGELQVDWRAPSRYYLRADRDQYGVVSFRSSASLWERRVAQTAEAHDTADQSLKDRDFDAFLAAMKGEKSTTSGRVVIVATDRLGYPAVGAPIAVDRPSWDPELDRQQRGYSLNAEGQRTVRVPPERRSCRSAMDRRCRRRRFRCPRARRFTGQSPWTEARTCCCGYRARPHPAGPERRSSFVARSGTDSGWRAAIRVTRVS